MDRTFAMYLEKVHTEGLSASNNSKEKNILQDKCNLLEVFTKECRRILLRLSQMVSHYKRIETLIGVVRGKLNYEGISRA